MKIKQTEKKKIDWQKIKVETFSVLKATEGGPGYFIMEVLRHNNIPCRKGHSPYVGQVGVEVPMRFSKRAERIIYH